MSGRTNNQISRRKILAQCDFDGTVTIQDASFLILDTFARGDWRKINDEYEAGKMSVSRFNETAINLVRATREEMLDAVRAKITIRPGFQEFVEYCGEQNIRLVIVSNGFDVYIDYFLKELGLTGIEYHAANLTFNGQGKVTTAYRGPAGQVIDDGFKETYLDHYITQGYQVIYIGDGSSDFHPAQKCQLVFARDKLLDKCEAAGLSSMPFRDFYDIIAKMRTRV